MSAKQTRDLTWDYVCELEAQRDELLAALEQIKRLARDAAPEVTRQDMGEIAARAIAKVQS